MTNIIQLLPESVANQIAAGEVIQRPSSVVKELLENSIDAKASKVDLIIEDYGKQLIQVIDNGSGMSEVDARMSLERHATSKIRSAHDLESLRSFGFRGEALASIVSIANVQLRTRSAEQNMGLHISINGSKIDKQEYCQCPQGTNIAVRHLFYNVPARRKFLKSDSVELKHILDEFQHVALAHPEIEFSLYHNQKELYVLKASSLRPRILGLFGKNYIDKLVPVDESTDHLTINGFVGKPDIAKSRRGSQFLFLNDRFIKSNYLNHAVKRAFMQLIPEGHWPFFVLKIGIDPSYYDINVHPTKQEVRFENEKLIYDMLVVSIKHALGRNSIAPPIDFSADDNENLVSKIPETSQNHESVIIQSSSFNKGSSRRELNAWQDLYGDLKSNTNRKDPVSLDSPSLIESNQIQSMALYRNYIAAKSSRGFILVNVSLASARINYEKMLKTTDDHPFDSQTLLFPKSIELDIAQHNTFMSNQDLFRSLGFDINDFGSHTLLVHAIPNVLAPNSDIHLLIEEMLALIASDDDVIKELKDQLIKKLAQASSQSINQQLNEEERIKLLNDLYKCEFPHVGPYGQKTFVTFDEEDIRKLF